MVAGSQRHSAIFLVGIRQRRTRLPVRDHQDVHRSFAALQLRRRVAHSHRRFWYHKNCLNLMNILLALINSAGYITNKSILPITLLKFGRTLAPMASGRHTLGRLECKGVADETGLVPSSCQDLWRLGHSQSGFYSVRDNKESQQIETVFCNMTQTSGPGNLFCSSSIWNF